MAKRPKPPSHKRAVWQENEVPHFLRKLYKAGKPGEPHFIPVLDRAYWLGSDQRQRSGPWIEALETIDKLGDKAPLLALLRSECELSRDARLYLADLLERYDLTRPNHRPRLPAYDLSNAESVLILAADYVRAYQASGMDRQQALAAAARDWSIDDVNKLGYFCEGKRGASRRRKKRLPPLTP